MEKINNTDNLIKIKYLLFILLFVIHNLSHSSLDKYEVGGMSFNRTDELKIINSKGIATKIKLKDIKELIDQNNNQNNSKDNSPLIISSVITVCLFGTIAFAIDRYFKFQNKEK